MLKKLVKMPSEALNKTSYGGLGGDNSQLKGVIKHHAFTGKIVWKEKLSLPSHFFSYLLVGGAFSDFGSLFLSPILFSQVQKFSTVQATERNVLRYVTERAVDPDGPAGNCHFSRRLCGRVL